MRRTISLVEYIPRSGVRLTVDERDALMKLVPGLTMKPETGSSDVYTIVSGSTVGVAQVGDVVVELRPKVGPAAILFMLSYELDSRAWQTATTQLDTDATLTEAAAALFVRMTDDVVRYGLLHAYQQRDDSLSTIRGRIRIADQIRVRSGLPLPTEVTYDEYTADIVENKILRSTVSLLQRQQLRSRGTADALARLQATFADISALETDVRNLPEPRWTRLNERYRPAVNLGRVILAHAGLEARSGLFDANALLVDMNAIFERFVRAALREALRLLPTDFPPPNKIPRRYLDLSGDVPLQPDLTWWESGNCVLVADCKYKRPRGTVPNADVYQMLAYLTEYQLDEGWLIYDSGEVQPTDLVLRHAAKTVHVRTIDATKEPQSLLEDVRRLAVEFTASIETRGLSLAR